MEKLELFIDPRGGISGDMFVAVLVSAGADFTLIQKAMVTAATKIGIGSVELNSSAAGISRLKIELKSHRHHLSGHEAYHFLDDIFNEFQVDQLYRDFGHKALNILLKAEKKAHKKYNIIIHDHHAPQGHTHSHDHLQGGESDTFLHEAQDILIDITGMVLGLWQLNIFPGAKLLAPVSVGGGQVECSHGTLNIPAPATEVILSDYQIPWEKGPIDVELCTPTGAALLAALDTKLSATNLIPDKKVKKGHSRGSKDLDIPPLKIYLCQPQKK